MNGISAMLCLEVFFGDWAKNYFPLHRLLLLSLVVVIVVTGINLFTTIIITTTITTTTITTTTITTTTLTTTTITTTTITTTTLTTTFQIEQLNSEEGEKRTRCTCLFCYILMISFVIHIYNPYN